MKVLIVMVCFVLFHQHVIAQPQSATAIKKMDFKKLALYLLKQNDSLYIVNFWASWCIPCREELPAFEKVSGKYAGQKVKVLLVSLDMPNQVESRLIPFIHKNNIKSEVILLDDPNQNEWIDKVDNKWTGSIPFTVIYGKGTRLSYERSLSFNELDSIVKLKNQLK
jgi:thiol-disulfide isomerase/thioredoxin